MTTHGLLARRPWRIVGNASRNGNRFSGKRDREVSLEENRPKLKWCGDVRSTPLNPVLMLVTALRSRGEYDRLK